MLNKIECYNLVQLSDWKHDFPIALYNLKSYDGMFGGMRHELLDHLFVETFTSFVRRLHR
jgi:hypothetical protein